ncbi:hypothetical protein N7493_006651 [Penicillium malachiteum]|uniref:Uncharacterized protein n=1 Tax=Penicillium malachiteum TaxID=1324776 RepID=A0AAD6MVS5_9EURO|nr:hypothetical protein N7493_006651 [Penicillium malachiteum]
MEPVNLQDQSTKSIKILLRQKQGEYFKTDQMILRWREALEEYRLYHQDRWTGTTALRLQAMAENLMRHVSQMQEENDKIREILDKARQVLIDRGDEYAV